MMFLPSRSKLLWLSLLLILAVAVFYILSQSEGSKLSGSLYGVRVDNIRVKGLGDASFTIIDGAVINNTSQSHSKDTTLDVLRLGNFYQSIKEDPLFSSDGIDQSEYDSAIHFLDSKQKEILSMIGENDRFIPTDFLAEVGMTNKITQDFLKNPADDKANNLVVQYDKTLKAYRAGLDFLLSKVKKDYKNKDVEFKSFGSVTDPSIIAGDLELMKLNSEQLSREIKNRQDILKGKYIYSSRLKRFPSFESNTVGTRKLLPKGELAINDKVQNNLSGPYLISNSCLGKIGQSSLYYTALDRSGPLEFYFPKLATDNYYQAFDPKKSQDQKYLAKGLLYHHFRESNTYRCNDSEYQAKLFTIDTFYKKYVKRQALSILDRSYLKGISASIRRNLLILSDKERELLATKVPGDEEASSLINLYAEGYQALKGINSSDKQKQSDQDELLNRYLLLKDKMVAVGPILSSGLSLGNLVARLDGGMIKADSGFKSFLYATRSIYSITFLNFAMSTYRINNHPKYVGEFSPKNGDKVLSLYKTRSQLLKDFSIQKILSWQKVTEKELIGLTD